MARVSESSAHNAINYSIGSSKQKLEDLQIKGSNLKRVQKPSDDPVGNVELMAIRSINVDNKQFLRNANYAKMYLDYTEQAIEDLTDIIMKAKEIAIGQSSDIYNPEVRKSVSREVSQLRTQALGISNRRIGNRYIFSGFKTLTRPFDKDGKYQGDNGRINLEVVKDFFVPVNMHGGEVFYEGADRTLSTKTPLDETPFQDLVAFQKDPDSAPELTKTTTNPLERDPASISKKNYEALEKTQDGDVPSDKMNQTSAIHNEPVERQNLFDHLDSLENALLTNNADAIQNLLESLDEHFDRLVTLRTRVGSIHNSVINSEANIEKQKILNESYKSQIEDADVADLFSDISKQNNILMATYKASSATINRTLLDFIR